MFKSSPKVLKWFFRGFVSSDFRGLRWGFTQLSDYQIIGSASIDVVKEQKKFVGSESIWVVKKELFLSLYSWETKAWNAKYTFDLMFRLTWIDIQTLLCLDDNIKRLSSSYWTSIFLCSSATLIDTEPTLSFYALSPPKLTQNQVCCKTYHHPSPFRRNRQIFSQLSGDSKVTVNAISRFFHSKSPFNRLYMSQIDSLSYHHPDHIIEPIRVCARTLKGWGLNP